MNAQQINTDTATKIRKSTLPREFTKQLKVSAGIFSLMSIADAAYVEDMKKKNYMVANPKTSSALAFTIAGFVGKRVEFNMNLSLETIRGKVEKNVLDSFNKPIVAGSDYKINVIGILPTIMYYWKQSKILNMYSGAGVGLNFTSYDVTGNLAIERQEDSFIGISAQLTPFGIRYGNKYAGFAEIGFGTLGMLRLGFCAGF